MSNLQVLARRCPVMGKALAVQSSRSGNAALAGAYGGTRAYHSKVDRAQFHTASPKEAQAVDVASIRKNQGMFYYKNSGDARLNLQSSARPPCQALNQFQEDFRDLLHC